ncbi:hypothetical protein T492DRAFT_833458 [Pavlovales sp. CCMP2436]|nr:hypothetical protein T492DRAFT_833458 [Pavlovales sp. CCMP2436]
MDSQAGGGSFTPKGVRSLLAAIKGESGERLRAKAEAAMGLQQLRTQRTNEWLICFWWVSVGGGVKGGGDSEAADERVADLLLCGFVVTILMWNAFFKYHSERAAMANVVR